MSSHEVEPRPLLAPDDIPDPAQMAIYARWTPTQRWERAVSLRASAWTLKASFVRAEHPSWSDEMVESYVRRSFLHARG